MTLPTVLSDFTVVELTGSPAGALCGRLLGELGAEVILVEPPSGHPLRRIDDGENGGHYFEALMAGKRSVVIDAPDSSSVVHGLLSGVDVFLTDHRSPLGTVTEASVTEANPELIYCAITPFGTRESRAGRAETDSTVQAKSGLIATSGFPEGPPAATAVPIAAAFGAIIGCGSVLARAYAGTNERIDVSMQDAILPLLTTFLPEYFATGDPVDRSGNRHPLAAPWNTYSAADGWVYLIAWTDDQWERFLEMADREDLKDDPRFDTVQQRRRNVTAVDAVIDEWIGSYTVEDAVALAESNGLTAAAIRDVHDAFDDRNLAYRDMVIESDGHTIAGSPLRLLKTPGRVPSPAPDPKESENS